jgi:hypothetical protein
MRICRTALAAILVLALGSPIAAAASSASIDRQFAAAVARTLATVRNTYLDGLSAREKREFVRCAQRIMATAPLGRKQYVLAARSQGEMRKRFDEVALDNQAKLKQKIAADCRA